VPVLVPVPVPVPWFRVPANVPVPVDVVAELPVLFSVAINWVGLNTVVGFSSSSLQAYPNMPTTRIAAAMSVLLITFLD